jgi:hypothetical protein
VSPVGPVLPVGPSRSTESVIIAEYVKIPVVASNIHREAPGSVTPGWDDSSVTTTINCPLYGDVALLRSYVPEAVFERAPNILALP